MKTYRMMLFVLLISLTLMPSRSYAQAQSSGGIPPRIKAFMLVTGYGAAGGALLGLASMAFGTSPRAIAQGASLGLYAGLLFGTYVIVSHHQRGANQGYDHSSPYNDSVDEYKDYGEGDSPDTKGGFFDSSYQQIKMGETLATAVDYRLMETKKGSTMPPLQINVFRYSF
jgi:hypothetical protein